MNQAQVLIVEDDRTSTFTLTRMLEDEGFAVCGTAREGEQAVDLVRRLHPSLVLMDISLEGGMDGVQTADRIKAFSDVPVIYMSGYSDEETIERATRTTPFGYIIKPCSKRELAVTLRMALYKAKVDRQLHEEQIQLAAILANLPAALFHIDSDRRITYANPAAELLCGVVAHSAVGKEIGQILQLRHLADSQPVSDLWPRLLGEGPERPRKSSFYMEDAKGDRRIVESWSTRIADASGEVKSYVLGLRDVTKHYEAEQRVRTMAAALASLEDAVIITDASSHPEGPRILYTNQSFSRLSGYSENEAVSRTLQILGRASKDESFYELMESTVRAGKSFQGESVNYRRDGKEFFSQWSAAPVSGTSGELAQIVFVVRDITHLRRLEENIRQSQKIEAVGRLAGGIAHDFNNLLSVINSYSDLQILKLEEGTPAMKYARQIRDAGKKGANLVAQLMTFSRRDKPNPVSLDLSVVVEDIKSMLRRVIRENIELTTEYDSPVASVRADQGQIEQALINLCVNARDAMADGGSICVAVRNRRITEETARLKGFPRTGNYVCLSVTDTGCGMDAETLKHIFEPFFTTKEIGKGTGLGLSTVYGIVRQLGGHIDVQSTPGIGTTFELFIPATRKAATGVVDSETEEVAIPEGDECILVVEDDDTFLDCISGLLSLHGYRVHTASDGGEAIARINEIGPQIRLLITDLVMPKHSGREVASRLLEKFPSVKVVFMTGYDDQLDSFYQFPGESLVLEKPFPLNTLLIKVRELLDDKKDL